MAVDLDDLDELEEEREDRGGSSSGKGEVVDLKRAKKEAAKEKKRLAKEEKQLAKEGKRRRTSKKKFPIVPVLIILLIVGAIAAVLGFNAFGIRDNYLADALRNVPIVKNLLPPETETDPYADITKEELADRIESLQGQLETAEADIAEAEKKAGEDAVLIKSLREIEAQQVAIKALKEELDQIIVDADSSAFAQYYEDVSPENAERLYKEAVVANQITKEIKNYVTTYSEMDAEAAAEIFEELITSDIDLVVSILRNMASDARAEIIAQMNSVSAASVTKLLSPEQFGN